MVFIRSILCLLGLSYLSVSQADVQSHFDQIKKDPKSLFSFFKKMPKGGDLHYHLAGSVYPEAMLHLASKENYCLNVSDWIISKNLAHCPGINTKNLAYNSKLYQQAIQSWSMKNFTEGKESGHDHFFNTFLKFNTLIEDHQPEFIAEVMHRAAQQNEHYLEIMLLPDNGSSLRFGDFLKHDTSLDQKRKILLANKHFQKNIQYTTKQADNFLQQARQQLACKADSANTACQVTVKFLYLSLREQSFNHFFAQTLNAFEAVSWSIKNQGPLVGVNLVQPEDGMISLRDYHKHMRVYQYLKKLYPEVNISLHAGELTKEFASPKELQDHIHEALFTGQAQRIGHGVDIAQEHKAQQTLDYMAKQHKAVEINLTSNFKILKVSGARHPLNYYLKNHVPVILSTDDEGILRTNLTHQYVTAVLEHDLDYQILKQINRNALTYSFLPGKSIWANADKAELVPQCTDLNSKSCQQLIKDNEKAQIQWNLEQKLHTFELSFL